MNCPNDQCFCDGSCYDNEQFNKTWEWYEEICDDLGLNYIEEYPTIGESTNEYKWTLNNRTI